MVTFSLLGMEPLQKQSEQFFCSDKGQPCWRAACYIPHSKELTLPSPCQTPVKGVITDWNIFKKLPYLSVPNIRHSHANLIIAVDIDPNVRYSQANLFIAVDIYLDREMPGTYHVLEELILTCDTIECQSL